MTTQQKVKTAKSRKVRKIQPYTRAWNLMAAQEALDYVTIHPCQDCGGPVIQRYCCNRCGSVNP